MGNDTKKSTSKMLPMSQWDKLFFYEDYKTKDIKNEPFINMHKNKNGNNNNNNNKNKNIDNKENLHIDKYINMYNDFIRENLYYEFNYQKMIDVFKNICIHLDNTKTAIYINKKDNMLSCNNNKICRYRKKLLFIHNYYIGHILYIIDSMLSLNMHHNSSHSNKLQHHVLNLINNNETYITDNFDSKQTQSHIKYLKNVDILNITQAYNRQKINNKYFYYLLSKQYQNANSKDNKKSSVEVKLIG
ncbi:hypothetical protein PFDG_03616 [Plasmodium falciparum Dd2]|uniref:Uncharacterized protein n=1 Tax=Plasmodium falciparum (isolate Dd2) TaxID=57267 RepID=A0A0L7M3J6_PLAF4|nr:hypothetical protein PFDG_03616 [Plasmodium falciparum Dd2]